MKHRALKICIENFAPNNPIPYQEYLTILPFKTDELNTLQQNGKKNHSDLNNILRNKKRGGQSLLFYFRIFANANSNIARPLFD